MQEKAVSLEVKQLSMKNKVKELSNLVDEEAAQRMHIEQERKKELLQLSEGLKTDID